MEKEVRNQGPSLKGGKYIEFTPPGLQASAGRRLRGWGIRVDGLRGQWGSAGEALGGEGGLGLNAALATWHHKT